MSKSVKVYNKGTRPVVFKRDRTGVDAIHPGKYLWFDPENAKAITDKYKDACSEKDYTKLLEEKEKDRKKAEAEAKKKAKKEG